MPSFIQELVKRLKLVENLPMHLAHNDAQILVTLQVAGKRRQAVKVSLRQAPAGLGHIVCLQSRAGIAQSPQAVRTALVANNRLSLGGLCLDTSTSPPSVDVVYNLVANHLDFDEFLMALQVIAQHADAIERRTGATDAF